MYLFIIYCIFIFVTFIQLVFYLGLFLKLAAYRPRSDKQTYDTNNKSQPVSIIICARNEAANLENNLPYILDQDYPEFEVIVVNDDSTDLTQDVLARISGQNERLRVIHIKKKKPGQVGKKFALAKGIESAQYELLLLTDADCRPESRDWIRLMQNQVRGNTEIVLGYGPYWKQSGFLNKFIRFETAYTAIQYFSFALVGLAYMGVGRNLLYKKKLFKLAGGFEAHKTIASGDDDLFINAVAKENNVEIELHNNTFVYSNPKKTWKEYYRQKKRHLSTGVRYKFVHKALLGLLSLSHFIHYTGGIVLLLKFSTIFVLIIYVVRIIVVILVYAATFNKLRESDLLKWVPILDAAYILYYVLFAPALLFGKTDKWK